MRRADSHALGHRTRGSHYQRTFTFCGQTRQTLFQIFKATRFLANRSISSQDTNSGTNQLLCVVFYLSFLLLAQSSSRIYQQAYIYLKLRQFTSSEQFVSCKLLLKILVCGCTLTYMALFLSFDHFTLCLSHYSNDYYQIERQLYTQSIWR